MTQKHLLDRPVWNALKTGWSGFAGRTERGLYLKPEYGPFGAVNDVSIDGSAAISEMLAHTGELWVVEAQPSPLGSVVPRVSEVDQMVMTTLNPITGTFDIISLGDSDADEMLSLALLTEPGPFAKNTHKLGNFLGIKENGRLIAMAGERMKLDGFTEVSGVCTHPDHRGRGLAGVLTSAITDQIIRRDEIAFLHCYASNGSAVALYERLGFRLRKHMNVAVLTAA
jgi:ribosomal protein S18 acetylase RimI-like enzyme